ncbi:hypothetical protein Cgig2_004800 [Carnegiea gigantea]|uniref:Methyltransferase PMT24 n=1 Tax=Carnegiea gigantea TaxID=171969 RepID=A0A9Q1QPF5_9CARY|nr:hypothetical protein Cgig2_004800 [Carnegiea gigantea]
MAMGRYNRIDRKKTSSYCSTATIVVIVSACLIGVWIMMPLSPDPEGNGEASLGLTKGGKLQKANENYTGEYEDSLGHLGEDAVKGNDDQENMKDESNSDVQRNENAVEESGNAGDLGQEQTFEKTSSDDNGMEESHEQEEVESEKDEGSKHAEQESLWGDKESTRDEGANTSDQEESEETVDPDSVQADNEKSGAQGSSNDIKQGQEAERKTDVVAEHDVDKKTIGKGNSDGMKLQDGEENQSPEVSNNDLNGKTSESGLVDRADSFKEASTQTGAWSTQLGELENQTSPDKFSSSGDQSGYRWKLCKVTAGPDYIPCLDNIKAIRKIHSRSHYEHQERHCPEEAPTCLVPLPEGYRIPVKWPKSREKVWFANVPHKKLAEVKGHQNWVRVSGEYLIFPGGGTQFTHGAMRYIDFIQKTVADISWGKRTRVVLDVGCGVASFGGYLLDKNVITMSIAPKDVHEAQVQFALERGVPAISAVMGTKRLPFPGMAFDVVHCARCRISWHIEGGKLLLELDRVLRPGGYFVWSATPVYRKDPEDVGIWKAMSRLTKAMCWELVKIGKDKVNGVGVAIYRKPISNDCYEKRTENDPPMCQESDDANSVWYVPLEACIHKVPTDPSKRGSQWPTQWPSRLETLPYWLKDSEVGGNGKAAPKDFNDDYMHWKLVVANSYLNGIGIDWSSVRNVMDMKALYGGFAAALKDLQLWVMNVVPINTSDTLPIIYERGLIGVYHDWCESFNTYPRSYDLLHANHLFSDLKKRCNFVAVMAEVDRILRPEGWLVVRDDAETIVEVDSMAKSLQWKIQFSYSKDNQGLLCVQKTRWRPSEEEMVLSAMA